MITFNIAAKRILAVFALATLGVLFWLGQLYYGEPVFAEGLQYEVFAEDLESVAALAFDSKGDLFATLEKRSNDGGVVRLSQGKVEQYLGKLYQPDGLLIRDDILYATSEAMNHPLVIYERGRRRHVKGLSRAEGIASAGPTKILVVEDNNKGGRLLRINPSTREVEVLLTGLIEAEGVCQDPAGQIYFVEKSKDQLSQYHDGQYSAVITGLMKPAYLYCLQDGSIFILEDRVNFGRLLHYDNGRLDILASRLRSPQSIVIGPDGAYYLAEQRRNRILRIWQGSNNLTSPNR